MRSELAAPSPPSFFTTISASYLVAVRVALLAESGAGFLRESAPASVLLPLVPLLLPLHRERIEAQLGVFFLCAVNGDPTADAAAASSAAPATREDGPVAVQKGLRVLRQQPREETQLPARGHPAGRRTGISLLFSCFNCYIILLLVFGS